MKYSIKEIASITKMSQKTIRRHIASKDLIAHKEAGKWQIIDNDFNSWLNGEKANSNLTTNHFNQSKEINVSPNTSEWTSIKHKWNKNFWDNIDDSNGMNFIDLFSGAGGLSLGFVMAGFSPIASVEILPEAVETYEYNFHLKHNFKGIVETRDIRQPEVKNALYNEVKNTKVDVIIGGFPCQGFSMAGNRIVTDPRNTLYLDMLEIVKTIKPRFVVMENVEGLRTMLDGGIERKILSDFKSIGYNISVETLNSADYYVPQIRKRVIFIANRIGVTNLYPKPLLPKEKYVTIGDAISDLIDIENNTKFNHIITKHSIEMRKRLAEVPVGQSLYGNYSDAWKKSPWDKPSCTIKENHGGVNIHPILPRVITPREMARLQSFPDDFIFKGSKKWQLVQIGNAVPPLMAKAIALSISNMAE